MVQSGASWFYTFALVFEGGPTLFWGQAEFLKWSIYRELRFRSSCYF